MPFPLLSTNILSSVIALAIGSMPTQPNPLFLAYYHQKMRNSIHLGSAVKHLAFSRSTEKLGF